MLLVHIHTQKYVWCVYTRSKWLYSSSECVAFSQNPALLLYKVDNKMKYLVEEYRVICLTELVLSPTLLSSNVAHVMLPFISSLFLVQILLWRTLSFILPLSINSCVITFHLKCAAFVAINYETNEDQEWSQVSWFQKS